MIITIDGPVASGKSSIARTVANSLGYSCLHTGLLYRAFAYLFIQKHGALALQPLQPLMPHDLPDLGPLVYDYRAGKTNISYHHKDIMPFLSNPSISQITSILSAQPLVRQTLQDRFFTPFGQQKNIVTEGRDCGTVLYPHADVKIFLTASVQKRAERVLEDKQRQATGITLEQVIKDIEQRDARDQERSIAPLKPAVDAIIVDSSSMTKEETVKRCLEIISQNK